MVGTFNPAVFHPLWFAEKGLLPREEADVAVATVQAVSNEVMTFRSSWLQFQCLPNRCAFTSTESAFHHELRDLAIGTFRFLPEEPVSALGLNRDAHAEAPSEAAWHAVGDRLAPNEPWAELAGGERAGLLRVAVQIRRRDDDIEGYFNVTVGPSDEIAPNGVFLGVNDHYQVASESEPKPAEELLPIIESRWEPARDRANDAARLILRNP